MTSLNTRMLEEMDTDLYLTIALADIDLLTGEITLTQAGHPHPLVHSTGATPEFLGQGGLPVGLLQQAEFPSVQYRLRPGERLLIYSDGFTEATDGNGTMLGEAGLSSLVVKLGHASGPDLLADLVGDVLRFSAQGEADDDLSAVLVEFTGSPISAP